MEIAEMAGVAAQLRETVRGDGVDLRLTRIDTRNHLVEFELDLPTPDAPIVCCRRRHCTTW